MISAGQTFYELYAKRLFDRYGTVALPWGDLDPIHRDAYDYAAQNFLEETLT